MLNPPSRLDLLLWWRQYSTHWNPFGELEGLGVKGVDLLPLLFGTECPHNTLTQTVWMTPRTVCSYFRKVFVKRL